MEETSSNHEATIDAAETDITSDLVNSPNKDSASANDATDSASKISDHMDLINHNAEREILATASEIKISGESTETETTGGSTELETMTAPLASGVTNERSDTVDKITEPAETHPANEAAEIAEDNPAGAKQAKADKYVERNDIPKVEIEHVGTPPSKLAVAVEDQPSNSLESKAADHVECEQTASIEVDIENNPPQAVTKHNLTDAKIKTELEDELDDRMDDGEDVPASESAIAKRKDSESDSVSDIKQDDTEDDDTDLESQVTTDANSRGELPALKGRYTNFPALRTWFLANYKRLGISKLNLCHAYQVVWKHLRGTVSVHMGSDDPTKWDWSRIRGKGREKISTGNKEVSIKQQLSWTCGKTNSSKTQKTRIYNRHRKSLIRAENAFIRHPIVTEIVVHHSDDTVLMAKLNNAAIALYEIYAKLYEEDIEKNITYPGEVKSLRDFTPGRGDTRIPAALFKPESNRVPGQTEILRAPLKAQYGGTASNTNKRKKSSSRATASSKKAKASKEF